MNTSPHKFELNRSQQRTQSSLRSLFPPVQLLLLFVLSSFSTQAHSQCYTDLTTGQRVCPLQPTPHNSPPPALDPRPSTLDPAPHCRITVGCGTLGSGTLIDRSQSVGLVLTCSHLFDDSAAPIIVSFPNGPRFEARLVDIDRSQDLAGLAIGRPDAEPLSVTNDEPSGLLTACGFGPNGQFRPTRGAITGRASVAGATYPSTTIAGAVRPGDSGGGVLNTRGQLIGVVWGQRDNQTYAICGKPVRDFVARLRTKLFNIPPTATTPTPRQPPAPPGVPSPQSPAPSPQPDLQVFANELDTRLRALDAKKQDKGDYLQPGDLNGYLRTEEATKLTGPLAQKSDVESKLSAVTARFESIHSVVETIRTHIDELAQNRVGFFEGVSLGKFAVGAPGLSGPLAAAVVIAAGIAGRRIKRRVARLESNLALDPRPSTLDPPQRIAIDSPPPPQRTVPETHFVPIEQDTFAKAHQWASEHVARKYPGASEILQSQDSLIKQFLAGK